MATDSQKQERRGAEVYGGKVHSASGATNGWKNDVHTPDLSIEFKTTRNKSYSLKLSDLITATGHALLGDRDMLFGIDFVTTGRTYRYVVMEEDQYFALRELAYGSQAPG